MTKRHLTCCCCGESAGRWHQHWNRDTGYGICADCVARQSHRESADSLRSMYGEPGVNYEPPVSVVHWTDLDRCYVLTFPVSEMEHAIALCGWSITNRLPARDDIQAELRRLWGLPYLDIPDGKKWFDRYAHRFVQEEAACKGLTNEP